MKFLIPRQKASDYRSYGFEKPFFAVSKVANALLRPYELPGLLDLIRECGSSPGECLRENPRLAILEKVEDADWLLACSEPFSPFTPEDTAFWPMQLSRGEGRTEGKVKRESSQVPMSMSQRAINTGPGKWVLKDIDHPVLWNVVAIVANRSGTIANEGSLIFSESKDWANTSRTLIHEWVRLDMNEGHFEAGSASHRYGGLKRTTQKYVESADHWALTGQSWHWVPVTANVIYEREE
ncbi:hypothetical protein [Pantoea sp. Cy-639]|uniref:hypothetical protein n=1 Tax=Pantoea sp. Cy-639 TaxID=2608360 RepID=UPI001421CFAE|nr:hypothetical protein [Pantoea sp. Cy-639]NIF17678.1 hypothetical protein [Pantoea sp. Cy-639]